MESEALRTRENIPVFAQGILELGLRHGLTPSQVISRILNGSAQHPKMTEIVFEQLLKPAFAKDGKINLAVLKIIVAPIKLDAHPLKGKFEAYLSEAFRKDPKLLDDPAVDELANEDQAFARWLDRFVDGK